MSQTSRITEPHVEGLDLLLILRTNVSVSMDESTRSYKGAKITGKQNPSQVLSIKESS
jgi:hypothetical protein